MWFLIYTGISISLGGHSKKYLFAVRIIRSNEIVAFTENGWIGATTNCIHYPFIVSIVCHMSVTSSYPTGQSFSYMVIYLSLH